MLIQIFAHTKNEIESSLQMLASHLSDNIDFYEVCQMANINKGYFDIDAKTSVDDVMQYVNNNMNEELDNVGIYFNDGRKIFVRIFKNAKVDSESYKL